ncbi:Ig-like domain-containing protein [Streptomyces sp. NBC_01351]|uniref:L,D-transpeptidase n=1 Tax=Streptomyces sp. NBC_01351 TaxID=2903833 RepID=UPI002E365EF8|nr:Ig-like domain-containing protein [Streptomyces sp. NBC_01351]
MRRARRTRMAVAGAGASVLLMVGAAAPGRGPGVDEAGRDPGVPAVGLLVGRVLDEGRGAVRPGGEQCTVDVFRLGMCQGWREERVLATAGGHGVVIPAPLPGGVSHRAAPGTDAGGPLEIAVAEPGQGSLTDVSVTDGHGRHVAGVLGAGGGRWVNVESLRAGESYTVRVGAQDAAGTAVGATLVFRTAPPADGGRLTADFGPRPGTYGAGEIVTAELSRPVPADDGLARTRVEQALEVTSHPRVEGAWHWVDESTLHYRPRTYWPAHTKVSVRSGLDGVEIGEGVYGGPSDGVEFTVADRIEAVTDSAAHTMTVRRNGRVIRTIPVTTGKAGFRTRAGVKVVLRKESKVRMRGDSIGIKKGTSEFYDLPVRYATRVTWSGEYVHAAPWSVEAQGEENVSHGCTGMSTEDAAWFFETVREGDIVEVVNSGGPRMEPFGNGIGDWNMDWPAWQAGSALATTYGAPAPAVPPVPSRLSPIT